jgi:hypothetical protein
VRVRVLESSSLELSQDGVKEDRVGGGGQLRARLQAGRLTHRNEERRTGDGCLRDYAHRYVDHAEGDTIDTAVRSSGDGKQDRSGR